MVAMDRPSAFCYAVKQYRHFYIERRDDLWLCCKRCTNSMRRHDDWKKDIRAIDKMKGSEEQWKSLEHTVTSLKDRGTCTG